MKRWLSQAGLTLAGVILGVNGSATSVLASGFAISEQSVKGLGTAFSSSSTDIEDATAIFFNPAGLANFSGNSVVLGGSLIAPKIEFENRGTTAFSGAPIQGGNGGDAAPNAIAPTVYAAFDLGNSIKVGIGVNAPFALSTDYDSDWVGRYEALKSELQTININPTIAAKLSDQFSIGAGLNVQYAKAELSNAIDFGTIGRRVGLPTVPQGADGRIDIRGDDWSVGYNLGLMYTPSANTRIGLAYRSGITHDLRGNADFTVPGSVAALTRRGQFIDSGASAQLKTPDTISLGAYQRLSSQVALVGDVTWTNWSRFRELRVNFDNPAQADLVQPENWKDTFRVGLGVKYDASPTVTLRAGVAFDPSPVRDEFRTARIPDSDRTWIAIGASYRPSPSLSLDVGYAHLFVKDALIDQLGSTGDRLRGEYSSNVNIIGVQVAWRF